MLAVFKSDCQAARLLLKLALKELQELQELASRFLDRTRKRPAQQYMHQSQTAVPVTILLLKFGQLYQILHHQLPVFKASSESKV